MKLWTLAFVGAALLAAAGCRTDPAIPILERELRIKEDEIYRLRAMVEDMQDCSLTCQDGVVSDSRSATPDRTPSSSFSRRNGSGGTGGARPPAVELPSRPAAEVPDLLRSRGGSTSPGDLDVPEHLRNPSKPLNGSPGGGTPEPADHGAASEPAGIQGPVLHMGAGGGKVSAAAVSRSYADEPLTPAGDSRQVASIVIDKSLTGGISDGESTGDQGLLVVIEPRDRAGRVIDAPAEVSVVVLDPALDGQSQRVARWDFTAAETAAMFRRTGAGTAMHLTTAWPGDPPVHDKLHLFVRYVTADGRKLQADQPIEVALPGDQTARRPAQPAAKRNMASRSDNRVSRRPQWSPERR